MTNEPSLLQEATTGKVAPKVDLQASYATWRKTQDPAALEPLLTAMKPAIDASLRSYANGDERFRVKANILARDALSTWDPSKGQMNTHVMNSLQRLRRVSADRATAMHVPENVRMDYLAVRRYMNDYKDKHGYEPDQLTIQDEMGVSKKRVAKALGFQEESLTQQINRTGFETNTTQRTPQAIWQDYVYHDLDPMNRVVFEHVMGYNGAPVMPKSQIAAKLNISNAAVSQRVNTINKRLSEIDDLPDPEAVT